jgi:hypothetical protein
VTNTVVDDTKPETTVEVESHLPVDENNSDVGDLELGFNNRGMIGLRPRRMLMVNWLMPVSLMMSCFLPWTICMG